MKRTAGFPIPLWIALVVAIPLVGIFALSLLAAAAIAAVVAGVYLLLRPSAAPPVARRPSARTDAIELDPSEYRRLPTDRQTTER